MRTSIGRAYSRSALRFFPHLLLLLMDLLGGTILYLVVSLNLRRVATIVCYVSKLRSYIHHFEPQCSTPEVIHAIFTNARCSNAQLSIKTRSESVRCIYFLASTAIL